MELIISLTLLAILCTAVISAYLFMGRNLERLMNTQRQGVSSRRALQQFVTDVSAAITFTSATTSNLTFTVPISGTLANCATTNGSTTVTCTSTAILSAGLTISGTGIPTGATVSSVTNGTAFVLSAGATATNAALTLSVFGKTGTVTYLYNSGSTPATFTRTDVNSVTTTLLTGINTAAASPTNGFAFYDENGNSVTGTSSYVKSIEFAFTTTSGNSAIGTQSSYVTVSPRVTLRNKPMLK
jgi:type II secretory pathway pseudopilin PulG